MAKRATKITSSADEALTAVEEALKIDFGLADEAQTAVDGKSAPTGGSADDFEQRLAHATTDLISETSNGKPASTAPAVTPMAATAASGRTQPSSRNTAKAQAAPLPATRAANDDSSSGSHRFIYSLQRRPSHIVYWVAATLSLVWVTGALFAGYQYYGSAITSVSRLAKHFQKPQSHLLLWLFDHSGFTDLGFCSDDTSGSGNADRRQIHDRGGISAD